MPKRHSVVSPKQVVYLWGAGATQAEVSYKGASALNMLMQDSRLGQGIASRILNRLSPQWRSAFVTDSGTDIEKLISLLSASDASRLQRLAEKIRRLYFEDICKGLAKAKILRHPTLAIGLLQMHRNAQFQRLETLSGLLTTNHDGLLQVASRKVYREMNIGMPFVSDDCAEGASSPPLLQLHGSFTWTFGLPLRVSLLREKSGYSSDAVWIPPTILKESKSYPYNKLAGRAYELLSKRCDVLRVVGSSLTQNDWNVLSMLFNAQRHRQLMRGSSFRVELIMPHDVGTRVARDCSYLQDLVPIGKLSDGDLSAYLDEDEGNVTSDMQNPLAYWMRQKIRFHQQRGDFGTPSIESSMAQISGDSL